MSDDARARVEGEGLPPKRLADAARAQAERDLKRLMGERDTLRARVAQLEGVLAPFAALYHPEGTAGLTIWGMQSVSANGKVVEITVADLQRAREVISTPPEPVYTAEQVEQAVAEIAAEMTSQGDTCEGAAKLLRDSYPHKANSRYAVASTWREAADKARGLPARLKGGATDGKPD